MITNKLETITISCEEDLNQLFNYLEKNEICHIQHNCGLKLIFNQFKNLHSVINAPLARYIVNQQIRVDNIFRILKGKQHITPTERQHLNYFTQISAGCDLLEIVKNTIENIQPIISFAIDLVHLVQCYSDYFDKNKQRIKNENIQQEVIKVLQNKLHFEKNQNCTFNINININEK